MSRAGVVNFATTTLLQLGHSLFIFQKGTVRFQSVLPPPPPPPSHIHTDTVHNTHNWTAVPLYYPLSSCQSCESEDVDCMIKRKIPPSGTLLLLDIINLWCSANSSSYFVIKCCNLLVGWTHSLSTWHLLQLMLSCISQNDFNQSLKIPNELVAFCVGGESNSDSKRVRFVPIKEKWVTLCSQNATCLGAAMHYGLSRQPWVEEFIPSSCSTVDFTLYYCWLSIKTS